MDVLASCAINCDETTECLTDAVKEYFTEKELQSIRQELFILAKKNGLTNKDNQLVTRIHRACGPSLHDKLANDMVELIYAVRNRKIIPRMLLKNGKRALGDFSKSREKDVVSGITSSSRATNCVCPPNDIGSCSINDVSSPAATVQSSKTTGSVDDPKIAHLQEEVMKLASTVESLAIKVAKVSEKPSITHSTEPCYLYVRVI